MPALEERQKGHISHCAHQRHSNGLPDNVKAEQRADHGAQSAKREAEGPHHLGNHLDNYQQGGCDQPDNPNVHNNRKLCFLFPKFTNK